MAEVVRCTEAGGKFYVFTAYAGDGGVRIPCMYSSGKYPETDRTMYMAQKIIYHIVWSCLGKFISIAI